MSIVILSQIVVLYIFSLKMTSRIRLQKLNFFFFVDLLYLAAER